MENVSLLSDNRKSETSLDMLCLAHKKIRKITLLMSESLLSEWREQRGRVTSHYYLVQNILSMSGSCINDFFSPLF